MSKKIELHGTAGDCRKCATYPCIKGGKCPDFTLPEPVAGKVSTTENCRCSHSKHDHADYKDTCQIWGCCCTHFSPPPVEPEGLREKIAEKVLEAFYPEGLKGQGLDATELLLLNMKCHRAADFAIALLPSPKPLELISDEEIDKAWASKCNIDVDFATDILNHARMIAQAQLDFNNRQLEGK